MGVTRVSTVSIDSNTQQLAPGETNTTEMRVEDVTDLFRYEFQLTFDTAVVKADKVVVGGLLESGGFEIGPTIDNSGLTDTVEYAYTQLNGMAKSGSGVLAVIIWQGVATSPLNF